MSRWSLALAALLAALPARGEPTPPGLKIAFLADQGSGASASAVLELVRAEGADAVVHSGDFDYRDDPAAWEARIDSVLGADFPYFASVGNHDAAAFYASGGYQERLEARMDRLGIAWSGDLGVQSTFTWKGIQFVMTGPDIFGPGDGFHDRYIRDRFSSSDAVWRISSWHKNQRDMQAGGKGNEAGWGVYEESRRAGAIIATGHEHSYSRTHLLSGMQDKRVASSAQPLVLEADDPATPADEGRSFAFVSGLGGKSIRSQSVSGAWFASIHTSTQGAKSGALFGVFHEGGDPRLASFSFKDVTGAVSDRFTVRSEVGVLACGDEDADGICDEEDDCSWDPAATRGVSGRASARPGRTSSSGSPRPPRPSRC